MTSTVTELTKATITSTGYADFSNTIGVIVILLLVLLLLQKELARASRSALSKMQMQSLDVAALPLLGAFALILLLRFLDILG
jgi:hypothetical protein